jgi:predicted acyltransferase
MGANMTDPAPPAVLLAAEPARAVRVPAAPPERLVSLDAYRGFVMLAMASGGLAFHQVAAKHPDSALWSPLGFHAEHVPWEGCSFWDLIQPSFMFMVGVALPYSLAGRLARGVSYPRILVHTVWRAAALVLLAIFLSSNWSARTDFVFVNVLAQIGLGYVFVFLLAGRGFRVQLAAALAILVGYWLLFALDPAPSAGFDYAAVGVGPEIQPWTGLFAHWNKNANFASRVDVWFLNLFPRQSPFRFNEGGYQTLNFVPSMATMTFGLLAGELLRGGRGKREKFLILTGAGILCLAAGLALGSTVCPIVKRIWTPSWAIYSTGWTCLMLAGFFGIIEIAGFRRWAFPLVVVGMNSIAMYCMAQLLKPWVANTLKTHFGQGLFAGDHGPILQSASVLFVLWLLCFWMYRKKIFLRI